MPAKIFCYSHSLRRKAYYLLGCTGAAVALGFGVASLPAAAKPSAATGKAISGMCAGCHGDNGIAINTAYPDLAGQNYQYLLAQLKAFKDGSRTNPIMHSMVSGLSLTQMQDISAYYASLHIKVASR